MVLMNIKELLKRALVVGAAEVKLVPGRRTVVVTPAGENEVKGDPQTPETINSMLEPVLTPEARRGLASGWAEWDFELDGRGLVRVTAELPGLEEEDVELRVEDNVLILRGEKRTEVEDAERQYSERSYGRFERHIGLPAEVDEERASATFRNGVLTVTLPKTERARQHAKRIPISH